MVVPNILAERYASPEMVGIFDPVEKVKLERRLWVAVLEAQSELGIDVSPGAIEAYRQAVDKVDLGSIADRDRVLRHDVKARIEEFNAIAGYDEIHRGLTSRDATENVEQLTVWRGLELIDARTVALLSLFAERAAEFASTAIVGRTHNVPAQLTTVGKRLAQIGAELLAAHEGLASLRQRFALRGIRGPVGSQQDLLDLVGDPENVDSFEQRIAEHLGIGTTMGAVGQVYPRSLDFAVVAALVQLSSGPANLALSVRLMAGHDLATEGFRAGQTGSSAMPHKMNTRSCERISGFRTIMNGYLAMAAGLAGDQWNEGDVSCSVVRRVLLPDSFFAIDGCFETTFSVLNDFGIYRGVIETEIDRYLPFLATTSFLMHAVRSGVGREQAHGVIKEHAITAATKLREGTGDGQALLGLLGGDERFPASADELRTISTSIVDRLGMIDKQIGSFCSKVEKLAADRPERLYRGNDVV